MIDFHSTVMGSRFFNGQLPQLIKALQSIHEELKRTNDRMEGVGLAKEAQPDKYPSHKPQGEDR